MAKVLFDCDNSLGLFTKEVDDGLALYYLLGRPDIDLLGVTTTFGNAPVERVYPQTLKLIAELGREDIPVRKGAGKRHQEPTPAASFLAETAAKYPGEVILLATGPLGNLRGAHQLDSDFYSNLKAIICMGGYLHPVRLGRRDVRELNLSADPEASLEVLNAPCPVTLMNAQLCLQAPFTWKDFRRLDFWSRKTRRSIREWLILHAIFTGLGHFYLWDLLPAVQISFPDLFQNSQVVIESTLEDLEKGILRPREAEGESGLNMPALINDRERLMKVLFEAWQGIKV
jgi:inosine-uridine nucleoside N-ribohydrolase